ncbi:MAG TPA: FHA domain-containing protein, partial [Burkholderiaceae bacterium]|nr:FHA domain-containing protein [Burkholderiaceae bacterium]
MASTQADTIELRVLYGPQAGARLALAAGHEYLLGTSPDCTVMLTGPRVAELHAQIIFDGSRPRIKPLDGTVCDAQGNQQDDEFLLTFGLPVELGGIWISVDHASAPWPDAEAVLPVASSAADPDPQSSDEAQSHLEPAAPETAIANHKVQAPSPAKKFPFVKALVTLGLVALSGSVLAVWLTDGSAPDASAAAQSNQTPIAPIVPVVPDPITQAIQEFGDTLTTSHDDKGNWVVSGYLPTTAKKKA